MWWPDLQKRKSFFRRESFSVVILQVPGVWISWVYLFLHCQREQCFKSKVRTSCLHRDTSSKLSIRQSLSLTLFVPFLNVQVWTEILLSFFYFISFLKGYCYLFIYLLFSFVHVCVCKFYVYDFSYFQVPLEARRRCWLPWSWRRWG